MTRHILLDSTPLGLISNPLRSPEAVAIADWVSACLAEGNKLYIPEVIDYELRRELLRSGKTQGIAKLNGLKNVLRYLPITTSVMLKAAGFGRFLVSPEFRQEIRESWTLMLFFAPRR